MEQLELAGRKFAVILTKCDKISSKDTAERLAQVRGVVQFCQHCIDVVPYSSRTHKGRDNLWGIIKREVS